MPSGGPRLFLVFTSSLPLWPADVWGVTTWNITFLLDLIILVHHWYRHYKIYKKNVSPRFFELLHSSPSKLEQDNRLGSSRTEALGLEVTSIRLTEILWPIIKFGLIKSTSSDFSFDSLSKKHNRNESFFMFTMIIFDL